MDIKELAKTLAAKATLLELQHYYQAVSGQYYPVSLQIPGYLLAEYPVLTDEQTEALAVDVLRLVRAYRSLTAYNASQDIDKPFPSLLRGLTSGLPVHTPDTLQPDYMELEDSGDDTGDTVIDEEYQLELLQLILEPLADGEWFSCRDIRQKKNKLREVYSSDQVHYVLGLLVQREKLESRDTGNTTQYRLRDTARVS